ncbi:hypothetical protein B0I72DRAFT_98103 [Yarrowia lipolytica]|nr:hypothetical protein YALI1_A15978g [Yarrowia lipolytica]KAB8280659.1 hypothetical protein BKA91DRAFT_148427 [Yarrowia lipolytica]KAE8173988.1 hypothetical protein BKA90DRAFT_94392 [Yarrowia lipolytica]RDW25575.1 hypothetical protein B0I71DRAFT_98520 [Yarrowia lipolytica]RDW32334.1 hypothetical protein B0I72DRAFT_98103 [Yarrowia lipolytica]
MTKEYTAIYSPEARSTPKNTKKDAVHAIRDQNNVEISAGDVVLLRDDPDVEGKEFALIQGLKHGDEGLQARCVLMKLFNDAESLTPTHVIPNTNKNRYSEGQELVMMNSIVDILVVELHLPVLCYSFAAFEALSQEDKKGDNVYFCRYVFDHDANKTSAAFDWQDITKDMGRFIDVLYKLLTDKPRRAAVEASRQSRHVRDEDEKEKDMDTMDEDTPAEQIEKQKEDDTEIINEDDEYDTHVEQIEKAPAITPRKRALEELDLPQPDHNSTPTATPEKKRKTENGHEVAPSKRTACVIS